MFPNSEKKSKKIENTNIVSARAENLSNSSLKTDDRSSGLVQTLNQFGTNDELLVFETIPSFLIIELETLQFLIQ